jgi:hypothetical protein
MSADTVRAVPTISLTDDELAAVTAAIRRHYFPTLRASIRCARRNRWERLSGKRLSKLSVVDHHFDQFGDLVAREVTRIGDKGLRIRRVDIRNSPFRSAVTSAGYNDVSESR